MTELKNDREKSNYPAQLTLPFPCLEKAEDNNQEIERIIPFIRKNPKYTFPYRICREFEDTGDAA